MSVLGRIVGEKRAEVERRRARLPESTLHGLLGKAPAPRPFVAGIVERDAPRVIAEVKRASPSKGVLRPSHPWRPTELALAYERGGAAALSVLTDGPNFWGSNDTLVACRAAVTLPVLRKDFIVDPYQVEEARWLGADCVLLMASVLEGEDLAECAARAFELGLDVLFESHSERQLDRVLALDPPPQRALIGINHRDLTTLEMDMDRSRQLRPKIGSAYTVVGESGLQTVEDLRRLRSHGIDTFLIGGHLAASGDPEAALRAMRSEA